MAGQTFSCRKCSPMVSFCITLCASFRTLLYVTLRETQLKKSVPCVSFSCWVWSCSIAVCCHCCRLAFTKCCATNPSASSRHGAGSPSWPPPKARRRATLSRHAPRGSSSTRRMCARRCDSWPHNNYCFRVSTKYIVTRLWRIMSLCIESCQNQLLDGAQFAHAAVLHTF